MNKYALDANSLRWKKARWAGRIGQRGFMLLIVLAMILSVSGLLLLFAGHPSFGYLCLAATLLILMPAAWYHSELAPLPPQPGSLTGRLSGEVLQAIGPSEAVTPLLLWRRFSGHWQGSFIMNHLFVHSKLMEQFMSDEAGTMEQIWEEADRLAGLTGSASIEAGHIVGALLNTSEGSLRFLQSIKMSAADVTAVVCWLGRLLEAAEAERPYFGGIGRDWANGFTPRLNQFGTNISLAIERQGLHFGWLISSPGVDAIKSAFSQGASSVALIGDTGVGKTSHINALAELLLEEKNDRNLEHRQIISLNPSVILSNAKGPGELEDIVMTLIVEAAHAGHIILFLDEAQLFFNDGHGSFDMTRILLPVVQSRAIQMVMAMTPQDYQRLKASNPAFASLLTPVVLNEPPEQDVLRVLEDAALRFEHKHKLLITHEALKEAYVLSGRYVQDTAYPGKAIQVLEQSLSYADNGKVVRPESVQKYIEQSRGVKVGTAAPAEVDTLLHLEDTIHKRMINQSQAVNVVASALRRARAGVANPRRPVGSFLFLGPTGVGKTELAKAVAATYFGAEENIIRLDMSEYQQPEDVGRLLSNGASEAASLIMSVRQAPFSVVLLDELEKAHPNILNLLLQLLDEGQLTDSGGRPASFRDCVIIATSNAGANTIRERIEQGGDLQTLQPQLLDELIAGGQFKPELLNRFDEIVLFRPLNQSELAQVVRLMLDGINKTLAVQHISVELTDAAVMKIVAAGYDARLGARPMRRSLQRAVENSIASRILSGQTRPGDHVVLDEADLVT